jgi:aspartate aminotransferase
MKHKTHLQLESSATMAINSLALKKKAAGKRIYNLCAGEPNIDMSDLVKQAVIQALEDNKTHYPPVAGLPSLRKAAALWINNTYSTRFEMSETVVTPGGKFGLFLLLQSLVELGDEVLIPAPYWVSYPSLVKLFNGVPVVIDTDEEKNWKISIEDLEQSITKKTKILILNNASNPTGVLYTREELKQILKIAKQHGILVISDEVYSVLVYDGEFVSCGSFEEHKDHVFVIQSCSKQFAMMGLRVGFVFGSEEIIDVLIKLLGQSATGVVTLSQYAALSGFKHANTIVPSIYEEIKKRRDTFVDTFNDVFKVNIKKPASALFVFVRIKDFGVSETSSEIFCKEMLEKSGVVMVPGIAFGKEGYVRCSFGEKEEELVEAVRALAACLEK